MNRTLWVLSAFLVIAISATNVGAETRSKWGNAPVVFEENRGQSAAEVRYLARGNGYAVFLTDDELVIGSKNGAEPARMRPVDRNKNARFETLDPQAGASHYFSAAGGAQGLSAPRFGKVRYNNVWRDIDMMYYVDGRQLEYDFILAPGARVADIRLDLAGGDLAIAPSGDLVLRIGKTEIRHHRPVAYQEMGGKRRPVEVRFRKIGDRRIGFEVGAYDRKLPLVIDPKLDYSTYWGGSNNTEAGELGYGITVDSFGNSYVTGITASTDFPLAEPRQGAIGGGTDAFLVKLSPDGNTVLTSTYIGGSGNDEGHDIKLDQDGNIYITGYTSSSNFPIVNGFQKTLAGNRDVYLLKLSPDGGTILYSTFIGGIAEDRGYGLNVTPEGDAYITGATQSNNFPVKNAMQPGRAGGLNDAFVTKIAADGTLAYSTFVGGAGVDLAYDIAVGPDGSAYITGYTTSVNFPLRNENADPTIFQGGPDDAFVVRLGPEGQLILGILLGGIGSDEAVGVALDQQQNIFITGYTASVNYPIWNAVQSVLAGNADIFVTKILADGSAISFSTFWGASESEGGVAIAIDDAGFVVVAGFTGSFQLPLVNAFQDRLNLGTPDLVRDAFLLKLTNDGLAVVYSTYLGGRANDGALGLALDHHGHVFVTGYTTSPEFPLQGALQPSLADAQDTFIVRFNPTDVVGEINTQVPSVGLSRISLGGLQRNALFGYADVAVAEGSPRPTGLEIIRVAQAGTTVTELGLPLAPPVRKARLFVEAIGASAQESIAIVNPGAEEVTLSFYFTYTVTGDNGDEGRTSNEGSIVIPSRAQLFVLLTTYPFNLTAGVQGTLTLNATGPLSVTAVRALVNSSSQLILSRIPIYDLDSPSISSTSVATVDHFVEGGGWHTQVVLVNNADADISGKFRFMGPGNGTTTGPLNMTTTASEGSIFPYFIPARSVVRVTTTGDAEAFTTGFVEVIPDLGSVTPGSFVFLEHGEETSATLEAQAAANRFRVYAENHPGAETQLPHRTALAITNSSEAPATLLLEMTSADGTPTGVSTTVTMPPRTQISRFLDEIPGLEAAPAVFRGLVTITVTSGTGVTVTSVQTLYNEDIVFLMTTTGPIREDATDAAYTVFPYIPTGAQYTTSVILFGPANGAPTSGTLRTWDANGKQLFLLLE